MASNTGKVPPHDEAAERAVLGALLFSSRDTFSTVNDMLTPADFYKTGHQVLYENIVRFVAENNTDAIDSVTIINYLRTQGVLDMCGGPAEIASLTNDTPTLANVGRYAEIVKAYSIRRKLLEFASSLTDAAMNEAENIQVSLDTKSAELLELSRFGFARNDYQKATYVDAVLEKILKNSSEGAQPGIHTGFRRIDDMIGGFRPGQFIVIAARPGVGKTAFALTVAEDMAHRGYPVGFFSLEMDTESLLMRLLSSQSGVSSSMIRDYKVNPNSVEQSDLIDAAARIYEEPINFFDVPNASLGNVKSLARRWVQKDHVRCIFVDYLTLINVDPGYARADLQTWEKMSIISREMKSLARELQIPVVCLSQLNREAETASASIANLRESGAIEQDADIVIILQDNQRIRQGRQASYGRGGGEGGSEESSSQDDSYTIQPVQIKHSHQGGKKITVKVAKNRSGRTGNVELAFLENIVRYCALEPGGHSEE